MTNINGKKGFKPHLTGEPKDIKVGGSWRQLVLKGGPSVDGEPLPVAEGAGQVGGQEQLMTEPVKTNIKAFWCHLVFF